MRNLKKEVGNYFVFVSLRGIDEQERFPLKLFINSLTISIFQLQQTDKITGDLTQIYKLTNNM